MEQISLFLKRAYELPHPLDGTRVLVDRLWPRGLRKEDAHIDVWLKDVAPSSDLRKWFNHDPSRFETFQSLYETQLQVESDQREAVNQLMKYVTSGPVTLVYAAKDPTFNHAIVLREFIFNVYAS